MKCECIYHRYHSVHIYQGQIYDHSQSTWDNVFKNADTEDIETYSSELYVHGMTADELRKATNAPVVTELSETDDRALEDILVFEECEFC